MATSRFYCCYLLTSLKEKCELHTYIGFTVHPQRRIRQHNGELVNGARQTAKKRPWEMVLCVYGFPSKRAALYFEWSWQHIEDSKCIRDVAARLGRKVGAKHKLKAKVRYMFEMLQMPPWNRMPLTLHWLTDKYNNVIDLGSCPPPPRHMATNSGPFESIYIYAQGTVYDPHDSEDNSSIDEEPLDQRTSQAETMRLWTGSEIAFMPTCAICDQLVENKAELVRCPRDKCGKQSHIHCLAATLLATEEPDVLLPTCGKCPSCSEVIRWPDVIARKRQSDNPASRGTKRKRKGGKAANGGPQKRAKQTEVAPLDDSADEALTQTRGEFMPLFGSFDEDNDENEGENMIYSQQRRKKDRLLGKPANLPMVHELVLADDSDDL